MTNPKADLLQGTLDMLILKALSLGPLHSYGIIQRIRRMSDEMLHVEQGALYPALYRIELKGWVTAKWGDNETGRRAKFYKLTRAGQKQLRIEEESWDRLVLVVARCVRPRNKEHGNEVVQYFSRSTASIVTARRRLARHR